MSPVFKPLNAGSVLQKTGHALPYLKKSIITLNLFTHTQNNHITRQRIIWPPFWSKIACWKVSVSKAAVVKHTQNPRKNLWNLKNIAFIEFLEFCWTNYITFYQNWPNLTQDMSQNAKIAFNFLLDFNLCDPREPLISKLFCIWSFGLICLYGSLFNNAVSLYASFFSYSYVT